MHDLPRQKLLEILTKHGRSLCADARRCESLLRDHCAEHGREIFVLVSALRAGVAADLLAEAPTRSLELAVRRLVRRLQDDLRLDEEAAAWAVESWAFALGLPGPGRHLAGDGLVRVVIAIDFGTARSGYAFAFTDDREIHMYMDWPGQSVPYPKTLTQMLYGPDDELAAWGHAAPQELARRRRDPDVGEYRLLRNFKMQLQMGRPSPEGPATTENGRTYAVLDLVTIYLKQLKDMVLSELQGGATGLLDDSEILWCLTVPAIWTDAEKQLMRTAAERAGLIGAGEAERLRLVLEPEAAALYCQEEDEVTRRSRLQAGVRYMVIDAGGGTVDLTVHEVAESGLREVVPGSGGACGSTYIDQNFLEHLEQVLGSYVFKRFREDDPVGFQKMLEKWERAKCDFDDKEEWEWTLPISRQLGRILDEPDHRHVLGRLAAQQDGDEDNLHLRAATMRDIFRPVLDRVVKAVERQFKKLGGERCDYLFLVGGFSHSPLLRRAIRDGFKGRVQNMLVPRYPGKAVLAGAVLFGLDESRIAARRTRLTYGCATQDVFVQGTDLESKRIWNSDRRQWQCKDRFNVFVTAGDLIEMNQKVTRTYVPMQRNATGMSLLFHETERQHVRYVDEDHVVRSGEMILEMPDVTGGLERPVVVTMYFGQTEIRVEARDQTSGRQARATLKFSHFRS